MSRIVSPNPTIIQITVNELNGEVRTEYFRAGKPVEMPYASVCYVLASILAKISADALAAPAPKPKPNLNPFETPETKPNGNT